MIEVPIYFNEPKFTQNPKNNLTTWVHIIMIPSAQAYKYLHLNCDRVQANLECINLSITKNAQQGLVLLDNGAKELKWVL